MNDTAGRVTILGQRYSENDSTRLQIPSESLPITVQYEVHVADGDGNVVWWPGDCIGSPIKDDGYEYTVRFDSSQNFPDKICSIVDKKLLPDMHTK